MPKITQKNFFGMFTKGDSRDAHPASCFEQKNAHSFPGLFKTRPGSKKLNFAAVSGAVNLIYTFKRRAIGQMNVSGFDIVGGFPASESGAMSMVAFGGNLYYVPSWYTTVSRIGLGSTSGNRITYDSVGDYFYIADTTNSRILRIKSDGTGYDTYGSQGSGDNQFHFPVGIDWDSVSSSLFIADKNNKRIVNTKWDGVGWNETAVSGGLQPQGIHYDSGSTFVYFTLYLGNKVGKIKMDGTGEVQYGSFGSGSGNFDEPRDITYDGSQYLYVTDNDNNRIVKLEDTLDGTGWDTYSVNAPWAINYNSDYLYIAESDNEKVIKTKWDGEDYDEIDPGVTNVYGLVYVPSTKYTHFVTTGIDIMGVKI